MLSRNNEITNDVFPSKRL